MKKIKGILILTAIVMGIFFTSTSLKTEDEQTEISNILAIETADARWVWFGCGHGGGTCGGSSGCHSVIVSSNACGGHGSFGQTY